MVTNLDVLPKFKEIILKDAESILDVGCGGTTYEGDTRSHDWWNFFNCKKRVGIDIWKPEIKWREKNYPDDVFILMDVLDIDKHFLEKSFDVVHCQNVVEHLEKDNAIKLIRKMETIAKKQIILGTPKGFRQVFGRESNPFEKHKCKFTKEELESFGYTIIEFADYFLCYKNFW